MKRGGFIWYVIAMALVGFLAQFQWVGYCMIGIFAAIAAFKRIESRYAFMSALFLLGMVPIAILLSNWPIAQNMAAYAFCLLVLGNVMMTLDLQRELKQKVYNKQRN